MAEMTRVEAAEVLDAMIFGIYPDDDITINKIGIEAVRFAITVLRGPQPDSVDKASLDKAVFDLLVGAKTAAGALKKFCQAEWYADLADMLEDALRMVIDALEVEG